ncbi:MAG: sulfite exporter TauE/SafE family protein [Acidobacteria bacterium]|nr:MAG: sulfite exporter TauE/SafE family protein [Acidobacteriota bacterium]
MTIFLSVFLAWVFQTVTGFGAGIFIVGFLSLLYDPKMVVVSSALFNLLGTLGLLLQNRGGRVNLYMLLSLVVGSVPGILLGAFLLDRLDSRELRLLIGLFILYLGLYDLAVQKGLIKLRMNRYMGVPMGFLSGIFAGLVGMGGPPPVVFLNQLLKDSQSIRLMLNLFFTSNILIRLLFYGGFDMLYLDVEFILPGLLGVLTGLSLGYVLSKLIKEHHYKRGVAYGVITVGLTLLVFTELKYRQ